MSDKEHRASEGSFDELAKGLASGTISHRRMLKLVGAALMASALSFFFDWRVGFAQQQEEVRRNCFSEVDEEGCLCEVCDVFVPCPRSDPEGGEGFCFDRREGDCHCRESCCASASATVQQTAAAGG